jgi:DOMON domain
MSSKNLPRNLLRLGLGLGSLFPGVPVSAGAVSAQGMSVRWAFSGDQVEFTLSAPTQGWLAIGFNESDALPGTYLVMGRVQAGKAEVVEHKTLAPGDYRPLHTLGGQASVSGVTGRETSSETVLRFCLPQWVADGLHRRLVPGSRWSLLLAYSREDDFQHHSMMRTHMPITL